MLMPQLTFYINNTSDLIKTFLRDKPMMWDRFVTLFADYVIIIFLFEDIYQMTIS